MGLNWWGCPLSLGILLKIFPSQSEPSLLPDVSQGKHLSFTAQRFLVWSSAEPGRKEYKARAWTCVLLDLLHPKGFSCWWLWYSSVRTACAPPDPHIALTEQFEEDTPGFVCSHTGWQISAQCRSHPALADDSEVRGVGLWCGCLWPGALWSILEDKLLFLYPHVLFWHLCIGPSDWLPIELWALVMENRTTRWQQLKTEAKLFIVGHLIL